MTTLAETDQDVDLEALFEKNLSCRFCSEDADWICNAICSCKAVICNFHAETLEHSKITFAKTRFKCPRHGSSLVMYPDAFTLVKI